MARVKGGTIGVRALKERCAGLVSSVRNRGLASEHELERNKPGSEGNPDRTVWGWLHYHSVLHRYSERENIAAGRSVRPDQRKSDAAAAAGAILEGDDEAFLAALAGTGRNVMLVRPIATDDRLITELTVYPKSRAALLEIHLLDEDIQWVHTRLAHLWDANDRGVATAEQQALLAPAQHRIAKLQRRIVWILTHGHGDCTAMCPYEPDAIGNPEEPYWLSALDEYDIARILLAHRRVNELAIAHLSAYMPKDLEHGKAKPLVRWSTFVAATASETGRDPEVLNKRWALSKVVTEAVLSAKAKREAFEAAKAAAAA